MGKINRNYSQVEIKTFVESYRASGMKLSTFARSATVPEASLRRWNRKYVPGLNVKQPKHKPLPVYTHVEEELHVWVSARNDAGLQVTNDEIKEEALRIAEVHGVGDEFKASKGWVGRFKKKAVVGYRVPTHTARKLVFTEEDRELEFQFFNRLEDAIKVTPTTKDRVFNFDQTMVRLVSPHAKTVSPIGAKQVIVKHPPGEKDGFTVALTISASGEKAPAIIVFKAGRAGVLSDRIMRGLEIPDNVVVYSGPSTWWTERLDHMWIDQTFPEGEGRKVLVRDQCPVHKKISTDVLLSDRDIEQIFIPPGRTCDFQPLDVGVNKAFKAYYRTEYQQWRVTHHEVTRKGYLKKPGRQAFIDFVSVAWDKIDPETVRKSFVTAKIIDREPDEAVENEDGMEIEENDIVHSFFSESMLEDAENVAPGEEEDL